MDKWKPRSVQSHYRQYPNIPDQFDTWTAKMNYFRNIAGCIENPDKSLKFKMLEDL